MSPRTPIVLVVLLALTGGAIWWFARGEAPAQAAGRRLLPDLVTGEVTKLVIRSERADASFKDPLTVSRGSEGDWFVQLGDEKPHRARSEKLRAILEMLREASFVRELTSASRDALSRFGLDPGQRVLVTVTSASGGARALALGAQVSEGGVAARVDDGWPPVEVDRQILDDFVANPATWREKRLQPFDAGLAQRVGVSFPKRPDAGFSAVRESGLWEIREPALLRADQALVMRLLASLSALESEGPFDLPSGAPPEVLVRYEVLVPGGKKPLLIEIGDGASGDLVPARGESGGAWQAVSLAGFETVTQPAAHFRSRRLFHVEPEDVVDILATRPGGGSLHLKRGGARLYFEPPDDWGWKLLGRPRSLPVDASAQTDFLQMLTGLEAIDFDPGPAFETDRVLSIRHGSAATEVKVRFGRDVGGKCPLARFSEAAEGHVRSSDLEFLDKPYWQLLARQAHAAAWFSLTTIEVEELGGRKVTISARGTAGNQPDFVLAHPHGEERRLVPPEIVNPATDKICLLTVESFVGHGPRESFGLDKPRYVVRWLDSGKSQGTPPDSRVGEWVTWRIGERGPDGLSHGELSISPGLIFKTAARDLDPFLSVLEYAYR